MKKLILNITILTSMMFLLNACVKDKYDGPDTGCIIETPEGTAVTIEELLNNYAGTSISEDIFIEGTVIADDKSGNFYKKVIIQDATGGIAINIDRSNFNSTFPIDRNIYVKMNGLSINQYNEVVANAAGDRILNAQIDEHLKRGVCNQIANPDTVLISDLNASYVNKLVTIIGVEFTNALNGITYSDFAGQTTVNLDLTDCNGSLLVRNSGYATFAADTVPTGNGSITGVFNIFGSDNQLFIRDTKDVVMNDDRCDGQTGGGGGGGSGNNYLYKDFDDNSLTSGGWSTFLESGTVDWDLGNYLTSFYGNISNWNGAGNDATEAWFISPSVDLSATTDPILNFRNAYEYDGDPLQLFVSTDYTTGNPNTATWVELTSDAIWSAGDFSWVDSEDILLTSYKMTNVHIAFKYTGSASDGSNWEIDEIEIEEL